MTKLVMTAILGAALILGVAYSPLLLGQLQMAHAQGNETTAMTGGNATSMTGNMTGGNATSMTGGNATSGSGGNSVTIVPGASTPSNGKFFDPATLNVSTGASVTWTNGDTTLHTVTSGTPEGGAASGAEFDSSYIGAGKTFEHTFASAGTFDYYCTLHPFMTGKVVVS
ncbi:MAG TPA: plastocyanin/azurin family copper-binding protein [Nitrososphaeraceae archaeon]